MYRKPLMFLFAIGLTTAAYAQFSTVGQPRVDIGKLLPKSPQAEQLMRVNEISVNASRGVPDISFNLYTATVGDLSIPITVKYDASGIKYDDVPTSVGLKWSLLAGGEMSRHINGLPDEQHYFSNQSSYTYSTLSSMNPSTYAAQNLFKQINDNTVDISHDEFSYTYLDKTGYTYYRNGKFWDCRNPLTVKVESDFSSPSLQNFTITDPLGNKAYFGDGNAEFTSPTYGGTGYVIPNVPSIGTTAWKLNKIRSYTKQEATFVYDTVSFRTYKIASEAYTDRSPFYGSFYDYNCNCGDNTISQQTVYTDYLLYLVKEIHTPKEDIIFYYSNDNACDLYQRRLDSFVVTDKVNAAVVKRIHFQYDLYSGVNLLRLRGISQMGHGSDSTIIASFNYNSGALAGISSKARDIYGYNNGASNSYLISSSHTDVPYPYNAADRSTTGSLTNGMLEEITYTSGGKSVFFFAPNYNGGPGARVDSIHYKNNDNTIAWRMGYTYSGAENGYSIGSYVNSHVFNYDNANCPVLTANSEIPFSYPSDPFYYNTVEIRKLALSASDNYLTRELYVDGVLNQSSFGPVLSQRIKYRGNSTSDIMQSETYTYSNPYLDSIAVDWLKPGYNQLPAQIYTIEGDNIDNTSSCELFYYGPNFYATGVIKPRGDLLVKYESTEYNQNNSSSTITQTKNGRYNANWQLFAESRVNSAGSIDSTLYSYLYNNPGSLTPTSDNLYGLVYQTTHFVGGTQANDSRVSFALDGTSSLILPSSFYGKRFSGTEFLERTITRYDSDGHPLEVEDKAGFYVSLIRNYNNQQISSETKGAQYAHTAHSSFEASGKGNWTYSGSTYTDASSPTGNYCYHLSGGSMSVSGLSSGTSYIVSYWSKNGAYSVNSGSPSRTGKTIDGWTYYEHDISGSSSVTLSGGGYVDEVRLYPTGAQMTTYTYDLLKGVSSICDANNRITYYRYDHYGRLQLILDQDKNIIKHHEYRYGAAYNQ